MIATETHVPSECRVLLEGGRASMPIETPAEALRPVIELRPNPIAAAGSLILNVPESGHLLVELYDITGNRVGIMYDGEITSGVHLFPFDPTGLRDGFYYCIMQTGSRKAYQEIRIVR